MAEQPSQPTTDNAPTYIAPTLVEYGQLRVVIKGSGTKVADFAGPASDCGTPGTAISNPFC